VLEAAGVDASTAEAGFSAGASFGTSLHEVPSHTTRDLSSFPVPATSDETFWGVAVFASEVAFWGAAGLDGELACEVGTDGLLIGVQADAAIISQTTG
jgi:hypothetical protein